MHATTRFLCSTLALAASALAAPTHAAVVITETPLPVVVSPGISTFATNGATMAGLQVTVAFNGGPDATFVWGALGANSGGIVTPLWSLTLTGDSFSAPWVFSFLSPNAGQLTHLVLNGTPALTVFDRTFDSVEGTPGSALGRDFAFDAGTCASCNALVNYSGQTAIGAAPPVGDIWQVVDVTFLAGTGPRTDFSFVQDSDNDIRAMVPEPETYALLLAGLGLLSTVARRRRARSG
jgi:hypothetical protein